MPRRAADRFRSLVSCTVVLLAMNALAGAGGPLIHCEQSAYDFGSSTASNVIEHVFPIANKGDAPLEIKNVRACCGSTYVLPTNVLAPGVSTPLTVRLSLRNRSGRQNKSYYVESNDGRQPFYQLRMIGTVVSDVSPASDAPVQVIPPELAFGFVRNDAELTRSVELKAAGDGRFRITGVTCTATWCRVVCEEPKAGAEPARIEVLTVTPLPTGKHEARISVSTDNPAFPRLEIPVSITVFDDLLVVPQELAFRGRPETNAVSRYLALRSRSGKAFRILGITSPDPAIRIKCVPLESGGYQLHMENILPFEDMDGKELVIETDSATMPKICVPFRITPAREPTP